MSLYVCLLAGLRDVARLRGAHGLRERGRDLDQVALAVRLHGAQRHLEERRRRAVARVEVARGHVHGGHHVERLERRLAVQALRRGVVVHGAQAVDVAAAPPGQPDDALGEVAQLPKAVAHARRGALVQLALGHEAVLVGVREQPHAALAPLRVRVLEQIDAVLLELHDVLAVLHLDRGFAQLVVVGAHLAVDAALAVHEDFARPVHLLLPLERAFPFGLLVALSPFALLGTFFLLVLVVVLLVVLVHVVALLPDGLDPNLNAQVLDRVHGPVVRWLVHRARPLAAAQSNSPLRWWPSTAARTMGWKGGFLRARSLLAKRRRRLMCWPVSIESLHVFVVEGVHGVHSSDRRPSPDSFDRRFTTRQFNSL